MIRMTRTPEECKKYNLDSVKVVFSGAAPLGEETIQNMQKLWPEWRVVQGYGRCLGVSPALASVFTY